MANVQFVNHCLSEYLDTYKLIRHCLAGDKKVKEQGVLYLPKPNPEDTSAENEARYDSYLERAVYYNVTARTLNGYCGQIFAKDPVVEVPELLEPVVMDADGMGVNLVQSSKKAVSNVLAYGRSGLFVDYPNTDGTTSMEQLQSGEIKPTITVYEPQNIINWKTTKRGAKTILSMVVLQEKYYDDVDEFETCARIRYRVLRLGPSPNNQVFEQGTNVYTVEVWQTADNGNAIYETYQPTDSTGNNLKEIPFTFIGSENNDCEIDQPPLYDLATLNIAHYRNSADYEESSFIVGQPTPYLSGMTEHWVKNVLKGTVQLGSRAAIALPEGGDAGLLQAESNTMPFEAMGHKERQMVALGAKLVEQTTVQRTATEANLEATSENCTLGTSAKNVSDAYTFALEWCAMFVGTPSESIKFELNSDFDIMSLTYQDRQQVVNEWQMGAIAYTEMRSYLKKANVAYLDDDEAKKESEGQNEDNSDNANNEV